MFHLEHDREGYAVTVGSFVARFEYNEDGGSGCTVGAHRVSGSMGVSE